MGEDLFAMGVGLLLYLMGYLFDARAIMYIGAGVLSAFIGILMMDLGDSQWR